MNDLVEAKILGLHLRRYTEDDITAAFHTNNTRES
jgi:hypothetical protein